MLSQNGKNRLTSLEARIEVNQEEYVFTVVIPQLEPFTHEMHGANQELI